jgi:hypothetical protein
MLGCINRTLPNRANPLGRESLGEDLLVIENNGIVSKSKRHGRAEEVLLKNPFKRLNPITRFHKATGATHAAGRTVHEAHGKKTCGDLWKVRRQSSWTDRNAKTTYASTRAN